jgi:DNA-binding transcriptional LysR family regulator
MLEKLRLFLVVLEEGSLRRAADRLRISQSAITRQMQALELDLGGPVLERTSAGVRPTNGGHALAERAKTLLADYDSTLAEVRRLNRGESERLRIGYIASAVQEYLGSALAVLRRAYPRLKVKMLDQTPGEMIIALRQGKIDLALTLHGIDLLSRDFYARKLATVRSLVALPVSDRKTGISITIKGRNVRAGIGRCGAGIHAEGRSVLPQVWRLPSPPGHH